MAEDLSRVQAQLFPLRKENTRLTRENHELRENTVRLNDELRRSTEYHSRQLNIVREELHDSRCLCEGFCEQLRLTTEGFHKLRRSFDEMVERTRIEARPESCGHDAIKIGNKMRYDIDFEKNDAEQVNEFRQKRKLCGPSGELLGMRSVTQTSVEPEADYLHNNMFGMIEKLVWAEKSCGIMKRQLSLVQKDLQIQMEKNQELLIILASTGNDRFVWDKQISLEARNMQENKKDFAQFPHRYLAHVQIQKQTKLCSQDSPLLLQTLHDKDSKIRVLFESLQQADCDKDDLEERFEQLEGAFLKAQQLVQKQSTQIVTLQKDQVMLENKAQLLAADLALAERQVHSSDAHIVAVQFESNEINKRLGQKYIEVGFATQDMISMTRENQLLNSQLIEVSTERDYAQYRLEQVLQASASVEHTRRVVELERTNLLNIYRTALLEKEKLEESIKLLGAKEERRVSALKILEKDYLSVKGALAVQTAAESRWKCERAALLTQISNMNKQLVHLQNQIEAAGKELSKSRQDVRGLKQNNALLNERVAMIVRRAGVATEANKLLSGRLGTIEREKDCVRARSKLKVQQTLNISNPVMLNHPIGKISV
eukprot:CAMPEP_0170370490 /NCGR_PEP_ID=MMETSP0117_2-20130122/8538_1 /TAXON_ID=400756 /ORGANISM="Durinskia baltica, Strain CSIRO CS-38" /LENGTH=599 /DNA_ID=CAMNT_0010625267 /DNA_START=213 /DNA_END=2012 /DNA_ORIENTATION=+